MLSRRLFAEALVLVELEGVPEAVATALSAFVAAHEPVLTRADVFPADPAGYTVPASLTLHGVDYGEVPSAVRDLHPRVCLLLEGVAAAEVLRVMLQTSWMLPSRASDNERVDHYKTAVLRDTQAAYRLMTRAVELLGVLDLPLHSVGQALVGNPATLPALVAAVERTPHNRAPVLQAQLTLLCALVEATPAPPHAAVADWFRLMQSTNFMAATPLPHRTVTEALATAVLVRMLGLDDPEGGELYTAVPGAFGAVNSALANTASNPVVMLAWLVPLYRKAAAWDSVPDAWTSVFADALLEHTIRAFTVRCYNLDVYRALELLADALAADPRRASVVAHVLAHAAPLTPLTPELAHTVNHCLGQADAATVARFYASPGVERWLVLARTKFPAAILPFVLLALRIPEAAVAELASMRAYATVLPSETLDRITVPDSSPELVVLLEDMDIAIPHEREGMVLNMPKGTCAKPLPTDDEHELLVVFLYHYDGWALLGRVLHNCVALLPAGSAAESPYLLAAAILRLLAACVPTDDSILALFGKFADALDVVFACADEAAQHRHVAMLAALLDAIAALVQVPACAPRVWLYLAKLRLLGRSGALETVLGTVEVPAADFSATTAAVAALGSMVQAALAQVPVGTAPPAVSEVLALLTAHVVRVFERVAYWGVLELHPHTKAQLAGAIGKVLCQVVVSVHGTVVSRPAAVLEPACKTISDAFLTAAVNGLQVRAAELVVACLSHADSPYTQVLFQNVLALLLLLVAVRLLLGLAPLALETRLYQQLPHLVAIAATHPQHAPAVTHLLATLVVGTTPPPAPLLLAFLGPHAPVLLQRLATTIASQFAPTPATVGAYDFVAATMQSKQEGLLVRLLHGDKATGTPSVLELLQKTAVSMGTLADPVALHLADALALAYNQWSMESDDQRLVEELVRRLDPLPAADATADLYATQMSAKTAEILALRLYAAPDANKLQGEAVVSQSLFLASVTAAFAVTGYREQLHAAVRREFEASFQLPLELFVRLLFVRAHRFGEHLVYNLGLMDTVLGAAPAWTRLRAQVIEASANLQQVRLQSARARAYAALLVAYLQRCTPAKPQRFVELATQLLGMGVATGDPAENSSIDTERLECAFYLVHETLKPGAGDGAGVVVAACELLTRHDFGFLDRLSSSDTAYRPALRALLVALPCVALPQRLFAEHQPVLVQTMRLVVARGVLYLCGALVAGDAPLQPAAHDLVLILSLVKRLGALALPQSFVQQLAQLLVENDTLRAVLQMYASADAAHAETALLFLHQWVLFPEVAERLVAAGLFGVLVESPVLRQIQQGVLATPALHRIWCHGLLRVVLRVVATFGARLVPDVCGFVGLFATPVRECLAGWSGNRVVVSTPYVLETRLLVELRKALADLGMKAYQDSIGAETGLFPGLDLEELRTALRDRLRYLLDHPKFLESRMVPALPEEQAQCDLGASEHASFVAALTADIRLLKNIME